MTGKNRKSDNPSPKDASETLNRHILEQSREILKRLPAVGPVLLLYMQSSHRRFTFISDLEWLLLPPLMLKQCKLYMERDFPIGYVSWAFLSTSVEERLVQSGGRLAAGEWKSGDQLWLIDMVAPFGSVDKILTDVRDTIFPGRDIMILAPDPETGGVMRRKMSAFMPGRNVH